MKGCLVNETERQKNRTILKPVDFCAVGPYLGRKGLYIIRKRISTQVMKPIEGQNVNGVQICPFYYKIKKGLS